MQFSLSRSLKVSKNPENLATGRDAHVLYLHQISWPNSTYQNRS
uniref:Uncharacterized protein n=1 Tax=Arundo donax TaxID=35708 RepID=A0A0A9BYI5_ARUDO